MRAGSARAVETAIEKLKEGSGIALIRRRGRPGEPRSAMTENGALNSPRITRRRSARRLLTLAAAVLLAVSVTGCAGLGTRDDRQTGNEPAFTEPADRAQLMEIQRLLAESGYDPGPVDGLMGPRTEQAIRRYQQAMRLPETGQATRGLLQHLQKTVARNRPAARPQQAAPRPPARTPAIGEAIYDVGDAYAYSDGVTRTVLKVTGDRVLWRDSAGDSYTAPRTAALPMIEWAAGVWKGRTQTRRDPRQPWPPVRGRAVAFDVRAEEWNVEDGANAERIATDARWTCSNEGSAKTNVPAGKFDTVVIACERSPAPAGDWQRRVWYYAPGIAEFVRRDDKDAAGLDLESIELVATMPGTDGWPPAARAGLKMALHDALSTKRVGEESVWQSTVVSEIFVIRITDEKKAATGQLCRNYVIVRHGAQIRRSYPAIACRSAGARNWKTPGLERSLVDAPDAPPPTRG